MRTTLFLLWITLFAQAARAQKVNDALLLDMYQNQRYADAANYLKSTCPEPVNDIKTLSRFAYTYQMAGKLPDALAYYQRMYAIDSTNIAVLFNLANINLSRENNTNAMFYFKKIMAVDSLNFSVNKQLGRMYNSKNDTVNTLKYLTRANTINPEDADVASELSAFLLFKQKNKEAEAILRRALAGDTTNIILLRSLMRLNYSLSKYAETIKSCKKLLELGDMNSEVYSILGSAYFELKNYECCIEALGFLTANFQTERTCYLTAESFKKLKDYNKAIEYFNLTLQQSVSGNTYAYYGEIADTYQTMRKLKPAAANYQKSLFFNEKPMIFYALATLYDNDLKDKKNAVKYYKKYLAAHPPAKQKDYVDYVQSRIGILSKR